LHEQAAVALARRRRPQHTEGIPMPLARYGVLRARPIDRRLGFDNRSPHYQIHTVAGDHDYRIAVNVKSQLAPSEVLYVVNERFQHPVTDFLAELPVGFRELPRTPTGGGLDYIRANLFDPKKMVALPHDVPGPDNDLNEKVDAIVQRALADEAAVVYAFGQVWGPESAPDKYFGFRPNRGVHDIHMNQGNSGRFTTDNGVWQDGGLIVSFPHQAQWMAIFLAFQSQAWHTDDLTGSPLPRPAPQPGDDEDRNVPRPDVDPTDDLPDGLVRIVGALVNPSSSPERETVTLLNSSNRDLDLAGWQLADKQKNKSALSGTLPAGEARRYSVVQPMALSNQGGIITLLDERGRKIDGVSYTKVQAKSIDRTLVF
jgi:uncharacterized protein YukJ